MSFRMSIDNRCFAEGCSNTAIEDHALCALHELRYIANKGKPSPVIKHTDNGLVTSIPNIEYLNFIFSMKYGHDYDHDAQFPRLKP